MEIKQSRYRYFYNAGIIVILIGFTYVFLTNRQEFKLHDILYFILLTLNGLLMSARAFYVDRYFKLLQNKDVVDFWLFFDNSSFIKIMWYYFSIIPFKKKKLNVDYEKTRKIINYLTIIIYILIISTIIYIYILR